MSEPLGRIIVRLGDQEVEAVALSAAALRVGRNPDNGLPLASPQVSRYHAELRVDPRGLVLTDLGSANGTFVGEERLLPNQPRVVSPGAVIKIGPFELIYEAPSAPQPAADEPQIAPPPAQEEQPAAAGAAEAAAPAAAEVAEQTAPAADGVAPAADGAVPPAAPADGLTALPSGVDVAPVAALQARVAPAHADPDRLARLLAALPGQPPLRPDREQASRYLAYLPMIFQDDDFLRRYMLIFEAIWEPLEYRQDHIDLYFDPRTGPAPFLSWLASWFGLTINQHWPEGRRRQVLSEVFELYRWRGTNHGLTRMIELCTGLDVQIDEGETPFVFRVRVSGPPGHELDRVFLEQLIEAHKPAHAGYILEPGP